MFYGKIMIYTSAIATFYVPSDISGVGGMHCEHIHAVNSWSIDLCQYWLISGRYVRSRYCPCSTFVFILSQRHWIPLCSCALVLTCGQFTRWPHRHVGSPARWQQNLYFHHPPWYDHSSITSSSSIWPGVGSKDTFIHGYAQYIHKVLCQQIHWSPCIWDHLLMYFNALDLCLLTYLTFSFIKTITFAWQLVYLLCLTCSYYLFTYLGFVGHLTCLQCT